PSHASPASATPFPHVGGAPPLPPAPGPVLLVAEPLPEAPPVPPVLEVLVLPVVAVGGGGPPGPLDEGAAGVSVPPVLASGCEEREPGVERDAISSLPVHR